MTSAPAKPERFGWLVDAFVNNVPGVAHALVVSAEGIPLTSSAYLPRDRADQLAVLASELVSLAQGASRCCDAGRVVRTVVELDRGVMLVMLIGNGSSLAVLATPTCDIGLVGYEMTSLVDRVGRQLTPEPRVHPQGVQGR